MTLGMAERRKTESPPDEESWGGGQRFKSRSDPKSPSLRVWLFVVQSVTIPVEHCLFVCLFAKEPLFKRGCGRGPLYEVPVSHSSSRVGIHPSL